MERPFALYVDGRSAGYFTTKAHAEREEERLGWMARKAGREIKTEIVYVPKAQAEDILRRANLAYQAGDDATAYDLVYQYELATDNLSQ